MNFSLEISLGSMSVEDILNEKILVKGSYIFDDDDDGEEQGGGWSSL